MMIELKQEHIPPNWMERLVKEKKIGKVLLVFLEGKNEKELKEKSKKITNFCKELKNAI